MKFDEAIKAIGGTTWDWSKTGFEKVMKDLGFRRARKADPEMPIYRSPWGKEWAQAIVEGDQVVRVEFLVEANEPREDTFDYDELAKLQKEYLRKYDEYVAIAAKRLGQPKFDNGSGEKGFPEDESALVLALWRRKTARIMVSVRNEGMDSPIWISILAKPLD